MQFSNFIAGFLIDSTKIHLVLMIFRAFICTKWGLPVMYVTRDEMVHTCCEAVQQKTKELEAAKNAIGFHMILKIAKKLMRIVYWTIERCSSLPLNKCVQISRLSQLFFLNFLWKSIGVLGLFFFLIWRSDIHFDSKCIVFQKIFQN